LEHKTGRPVSLTVAAHGWLEEIYDPVVVSIPAGLRDRFAPPEIFHEILEHGWYLSEQAGRDFRTVRRSACTSHSAATHPECGIPHVQHVVAAHARRWIRGTPS